MSESLLVEKARECLRWFVKQYQGPPLVLVLAGGGINLSQLGAVPGAGRILSAVFIPYSTEQQDLTIGRELGEHLEDSAVSETRVRQLARAHGIATPMELYGRPVRIVVVSAALTASRYRRGDNHAWVWLDDRTYHLEFPKPDEEQHRRLAARPELLDEHRYLEDWLLTGKVLGLILDHERDGIAPQERLLPCAS